MKAYLHASEYLCACIHVYIHLYVQLSAVINHGIIITRVVPTIHEVFEDIRDGLFGPNHWQEVSTEDTGAHDVICQIGNHSLILFDRRRLKTFLTKGPVHKKGNIP